MIGVRRAPERVVGALLTGLLLSMTLAASAVIAAPSAGAAPPPVGTITNHAPFAITGVEGPSSIARGPDGAMWFTNRLGSSIGRVTDAGAATYFTGPDISQPDKIVAGPDGALWFVNGTGTNWLGRITTAGVATSFPGTGVGTARPIWITAGPDNALWFTDSGTIGRIAMDGTTTAFADWRISAGQITAGADGALWWASGSSIGRITTAGVLSFTSITDGDGPYTMGGIVADGDTLKFVARRDGYWNVPAATAMGLLSTSAPAPTSLAPYKTATPVGPLALGPASAVWVLDAGARSIASLQGGGTYSFTSTITSIAVAADGHVWATHPDANKVTRDASTIVEQASRPVESVVTGADGAMWFTLPPSRIGRLTLGGQYSEYTTPTPIVPGTSLVRGADDALWFLGAAYIPTSHYTYVHRISPSGAFTSTRLDRNVPVEGGDIAAGPDGALWFGIRTPTGQTQYRSFFGRITTKGVFDTFLDNPKDNRPQSIVAGTDGAMWFTTERTTAYMLPIGRIAPDRTFSYRAGPSNTTAPTKMTTGPDGALWFMNHEYPLTMSRLATDSFGSMFGTDFPAPFNGDVNDVAAGPDGRLWITLTSGAIVRMTTAGAYETFALPSPTQVLGITQGPDGGMWFAQRDVPIVASTSWSLGRIEALGTVSAPAAPEVFATVGDGWVRATWSVGDGGSPLTGVTVTLSPGGATCTWTSGPQSCTVTGLPNNTTYTVTARATNAVGTGPPSVVGVLALPHKTPPAPAFLSAVNSGAEGDCATLTWWPPSGDPVLQVIVDVTTAFSTSLGRLVFPGGPNARTYCSTYRGSTLYFAVSFVTAYDTGPVARASYKVGVPAPPGRPVASSADGAATVTWTQAMSASRVYTSTITPYRSGVAQPPVTVYGAALSQTLTGLTNGASYTFTVATTSYEGTSLPSPQSAPITIGVPPAPAFPAAASGNASATVSWWPTALPITGSVITPYLGGVAQTPVSFADGASSHVITGLTNGQTYTFGITIANANGTSPASMTAPVLIGLPGTPGFVKATKTAPGQVTVTWWVPPANGSPIASSTITPHDSAGVALAPVTVSGPGGSAVVTGLTVDTPYQFTVQATNGVGSGPTSAKTASVWA
jgi:streptogramin lyase